MTRDNTRIQFRENCLDRDNYSCVVPWCSKEVTENPNKDGEVHHIYERKLWENGGYIKRNGATVCSFHHKMAEQNEIPPQALFKWTGEKSVRPEEVEKHSDKWGEKYSDTPSELREYIKYPSTGHLPFSPENDDTRVDFEDFQSMEAFTDKELVITVKRDGSNLNFRHDKPVARNGSSATQEQFDLAKKIHAEIQHKIPEHIMISGEWLYAYHSIHYSDSCENKEHDHAEPVRDYFEVFGVYDHRHDIWLSWDKVKEWAEKIGFPTVPVVKENISYENKQEAWAKIQELGEKKVREGEEGIVVRPRYPYHFGEFTQKVGKYVREGHVKTGEHHWRKGGETETNALQDT